VSDLAASELMDRIYRRQRHFYDFTRKYYLLGRDRLIDGLAPPPGKPGARDRLRHGTQPGRRGPHLAAGTALRHRHLGRDADTGRQVVGRAGLAQRIELARADATSFDPAWLFGVPCFSRIIFSYSLSMMPAWRAVLGEALRWLAPDGELHIVDFGGQERLPRWFRAGLRRWLARFTSRRATSWKPSLRD